MSEKCADCFERLLADIRREDIERTEEHFQRTEIEIAACGWRQVFNGHLGALEDRQDERQRHIEKKIAEQPSLESVENCDGPWTRIIEVTQSDGEKMQIEQTHCGAFEPPRTTSRRADNALLTD